MMQPIQDATIEYDALFTVGSFGVGSVYGFYEKLPYLQSGIFFAINYVALRILKHLVTALAERNGWRQSTNLIAQGVSSALLQTALIASGLALGVILPSGAAIIGGFAFVFYAHQILYGIKFAV